jgi:hypothetical protein
MSVSSYYTQSGSSNQGQPSNMHYSDWSAANSAANSADYVPSVPIAPPPVRYVQSSADPNATTLSMEHFKPSSRKEYMNNSNSPSEDDESVTQKWWFPWAVGGGGLLVVAIIGGAMYNSHNSNSGGGGDLSGGGGLTNQPLDTAAFGSSGILNDLEFL